MAGREALRPAGGTACCGWGTITGFSSSIACGSGTTRAAASGGSSRFAGMSMIAPQSGHFPFLPAIASSTLNPLLHWLHVS